MVFGVPMPLDTPGDIPSTDDLYSVLNGLANPNVPFSLKGHLVEDGIGNLEGRAADALMRKAVARGLLPLSFQITDIATLGNGVASANVTASGPGMAPTTENITFVDHGGWKLSSGSAAQVMQMFSA